MRAIVSKCSSTERYRGLTGAFRPRWLIRLAANAASPVSAFMFRSASPLLNDAAAAGRFPPSSAYERWTLEQLAVIEREPGAAILLAAAVLVGLLVNAGPPERHERLAGALCGPHLPHPPWLPSTFHGCRDRITPQSGRRKPRRP